MHSYCVHKGFLLRPDIQPLRAPAFIAVCNLLSSLVAGRMADKYALGTLLSLLA
jgi:hypothetical protein